MTMVLCGRNDVVGDERAPYYAQLTHGAHHTSNKQVTKQQPSIEEIHPNASQEHGAAAAAAAGGAGAAPEVCLYSSRSKYQRSESKRSAEP